MIMVRPGLAGQGRARNYIKNKMVQGKWEKGIWKPAVSNPEGFNQHKKNPKPKVEIIKKVTKEAVKMAYREAWIAKRNYQSKVQIFKHLERQFMGYDKIHEEIEKDNLKS